MILQSQAKENWARYLPGLKLGIASSQAKLFTPPVIGRRSQNFDSIYLRYAK
jgi:hypothetical protein